MREKVETSAFASDVRVRQMMTEMEDLYATRFGKCHKFVLKGSGQPYLCYQQFTATKSVPWPACALVHRRTVITSARSAQGWQLG